ncbi:MAG: hypothetical protein NWF03_09170 [Candidatus Bathyarchaeota archaeon]|nr:hypothetical protein [Candidatus Bathyarchaeota archaeon]
MPYKPNAANKTKPYNDVVAEAVDETLNHIFKKEGTTVIYKFLETHAKLKITQVADKPEIFSKNLHKLMSSATHVIEQTILRKLYSKLGIKFEEKNGYKFSDYIQELKGK